MGVFFETLSVRTYQSPPETPVNNEQNRLLASCKLRYVSCSNLLPYDDDNNENHNSRREKIIIESSGTEIKGIGKSVNKIVDVYYKR